MNERWQYTVMRRWVKQAGGKVLLADSEAGVEVSPLVSYSGEDLEPLCAQRTFRQPFDVFLQVSSGHSIA